MDTEWRLTAVSPLAARLQPNGEHSITVLLTANITAYEHNESDSVDSSNKIEQELAQILEIVNELEARHVYALQSENLVLYQPAPNELKMGTNLDGDAELEVEELAPLDTAEFNAAIRYIIEQQMKGYNGSPRRKPVRVQRIREVFRNRERESIAASEFAEAFSETKNPFNSAQTAISWLNKQLSKCGFEIETIRITKYRIRKNNTST